MMTGAPPVEILAGCRLLERRRLDNPYSSRVFSERQRWYTDQFGFDEVYTPQIVVNGARETLGSNAIAIRNAVEAASRSEEVSLTLSDAIRNGNQVKFHIMSTNLRGGDSTATVYVAVAEGKV